MISILIPVYNFNPMDLLEALSGQLHESGVEGEIIAGNDSSDLFYAPVFEKASMIPGVSIYSSDKNLGRSMMRNRLAAMARFPFLLFIDGDAGIENRNFLDNYLKKADEGTVVCGGTAYKADRPVDNSRILRWKYGLKREVRSAVTRSSSPYSSFSSFNFMVPKRIFDLISFDEGLRRYGHEDTLYGIELEKNKIKIEHIDNPLIHLGLDNSVLFLEKTAEGLENLTDLYRSYHDAGILVRRIRVLRQYLQLRKTGLAIILKFICPAFSGSIKRNLMGPSPSVFLFDIYKLCIINKIQD